MLEAKIGGCYYINTIGDNAGDVQATLDYGFESIKLDGCGNEKNVSYYAELFNASGQPVMIENCHNGNPTYPVRDPSTGLVDCPMNFFRSSTDIRHRQRLRKTPVLCCNTQCETRGTPELTFAAAGQIHSRRVRT